MIRSLVNFLLTAGQLVFQGLSALFRTGNRQGGTFIQIALVCGVAYVVSLIPSWLGNLADSLRALDSIAVGIGICCGAGGYLIGLPFEARQRSAPALCALLGIAFGYLAASAVLYILRLLLCLAALAFAILSFRTIHNACMQIAQLAGIRIGQARNRDFLSVGDRMTSEYEKRKDWYGSVPIHETYQKQLLDSEEHSYTQALLELSSRHPYLGTSNSSPLSGFSSWFDNGDESE